MSGQLLPVMPIYCPYCGKQYRPKIYTVEAIADALKVHIAKCPGHPMHQVIETLKAGRDLMAPLMANSVLNVSPAAVRAWVDKAIALINNLELVKAKPSAKKRAGGKS